MYQHFLFCSCLFNGEDSQFSKKALEILEQAKVEVDDSSELGGQLAALEQAIEATKEAALDAADSESVVTGGDRDDVFSRPPSSAAHSIADDSYMDFDEGSQPGLLHSRTEQDQTPEPDDDSDEETRNLMPVPNSALHNEAVPVAEEDIVDENYDPEDFLLQQFNNPPPAPAPHRDSDEANYEDPFHPPDSVAPLHPINPGGYHIIPPSVRQPDDDTPGDIWF